MDTVKTNSSSVAKNIIGELFSQTPKYLKNSVGNISEIVTEMAGVKTTITQAVTPTLVELISTVSTKLKPSTIIEKSSISSKLLPVSNISTSSPLTTIAVSLSTTFVGNVTSATNVSYSNSTSLPEVICSHAAFHEFPPDLFTSSQRDHGAIICHVILAIYMFVALAIVCDDYFVTSLDKVCEHLGFSEDVAGATFMAAGSSTPELFTAIIGVFITKGDVGVGTIVGSAVFNMLFVIGICGLLVKETVNLSWWPLCRDSIYYAISIIVLILVVEDTVVTWYESVIMLVMYAGYIVIMRFNRSLQTIVTDKLQWLTTKKLDSNGIIGRQLNKFQGDYEQFGDDDDVFSNSVDATELTQVDTSNLTVSHYIRSTKIKLTFEEAAFRIMMGRHFNKVCRFKSAGKLIICFHQRMLLDSAYVRRQQFKKATRTSTMRSYAKSVRNWMSMALEGEDFDSWRKVPSLEEVGWVKYAAWLLTYPLKTLLYFTVPDCRKARFEKYFLATFVISILWIAVFSYVMVWMVTYIGFAFGIPDSVMGITFLAAGTSIPDAMASVFVVKQGMGDMAVSNCVGSNIFDILLGLSFPWFLKTAIVSPGSTAHINSNGIIFSIVLLFLTVIITVGAIHLSGWVLNRCVGMTCLGVYGIYLTFSIMTECNVFGFVNPPMCKE